MRISPEMVAHFQRAPNSSAKDRELEQSVKLLTETVDRLKSELAGFKEALALIQEMPDHNPKDDRP